MKIEPIDTSTTAGKARVMQLAAEGRGLAYKNGFNKKWERHVQPEYCDWDWRSASFAIIAETGGPHEVWVEVCDRGFAHTVNASPVSSKGYVAVRYVRADE